VHSLPVPALRPGAHVRVIAPASPFDVADFEGGVAHLRERYEVSYDEALLARDGYLAGDDARRLDELRRALTEPGIDAVVAARGGYGCTRLLGGVDVDDVSPRLLVGFSDVTALHALFARAGLRSLHGPMVAALGRADEVERARWRAAVEGAAPPRFTGLTRVAPGRAEGPVIGGNLSVLCALVGTPYAPPLDGRVLFLEEVGEAPYRVDRMLTTLRQAGWLSRVSGIAVGQLTRCEPRADGREITHVFDERLGDLGVPVIRGVPAGHEAPNVPLPMGAPAVVDGDTGSFTFGEGAVVA